MQDPDNAIGSYNAIRTYLWAGMMSPKDPAYAVLKRQFQPMVEAAVTLGAPPEKVNLNTLAMNKAGNPGFARLYSGTCRAHTLRTENGCEDPHDAYRHARSKGQLLHQHARSFRSRV